MTKKKTGIIIGAIVGVIILLLIISYVLITQSPTRVAFLNIESGSVEVDSGSGWQAAVNGMDLSLNDKIKTNADSEASVILYESAIISLNPNTEIIIADLNKEKAVVEQTSGTTWNKFTGLSGLKGLEVQTPTTVATVRGTTFTVTMEAVLVAEGRVTVTNRETGAIVTIEDGMKATLVDGQLVVEHLTQEDLEKTIYGLQKHLTQLKSIRTGEMDKHPTTVSMIKSMYKLSDRDIEEKIGQIDRGELDEDDLAEQAPFEMDSVDKFVALTKEIKKPNLAIVELEQMMQEATA